MNHRDMADEAYNLKHDVQERIDALGYDEQGIDKLVGELAVQYKDNEAMLGHLAAMRPQNASHLAGKTTNPEVWVGVANAAQDVFHLIPSTLRNDRNFLLELLSINGFPYMKLSPAERNDEELLLTAINLNLGCGIEYEDIPNPVPLKIRGRRDFFRRAVRVNPEAISWASTDIRTDVAFAHEVSRIEPVSVHSFKFDFLESVKDTQKACALVEERFIEYERRLVAGALTIDKPSRRTKIM